MDIHETNISNVARVIYESYSSGDRKARRWGDVPVGEVLKWKEAAGNAIALVITSVDEALKDQVVDVEVMEDGKLVKRRVIDVTDEG